MVPVSVLIHPSQFPETVRRELLESLRTRCINHKFHYQTVAQTGKWLALHNAHSPARDDPEYAAIYDRSFAAVVQERSAGQVHVVGLGCGGGQKETRLLGMLRAAGKRVRYTPVDVGVPMVLIACRAASQVVAAEVCHPLVCDLVTATDVDRWLDSQPTRGWPRVVTFLGMIPNFEPPTILPRLAGLVRPGDQLLLSANLAPGADYAAGVQAVLPQYDNELTRDWLLTFLLELGVQPRDGKTRFFVEDGPPNDALKRITAEFVFRQSRLLRVHNERFAFQPEDRIRLFFSYRHTPARVADALASVGLNVDRQWITPSGEEGVFLCRSTPGARLHNA